MNMKKAVFLDRDGVLNEERGDYTFRIEDFIICEGVREALIRLKNAGFLLIVITNQGGINRGFYTKEDVLLCHQYLQEQTGYLIDDLYYSPYNSHFTNSLSRKPQTLLFEKAIAKYNINPAWSFMVGDSLRDMQAAACLGIKCVKIGEKIDFEVDKYASNLLEASKWIIDQKLY
jgi:D-glycero-D-manno-heptose 1,7-bisphosphate phosphatase